MSSATSAPRKTPRPVSSASWATASAKPAPVAGEPQDLSALLADAARPARPHRPAPAAQFGQIGEVHFAAPRMEIKGTLRHLRQLAEAARHRYPLDRVAAQVFQHAADKSPMSISADASRP